MLNHESGSGYPDFKQKGVTFLSTSISYYVSNMIFIALFIQIIINWQNSQEMLYLDTRK